jgi:hypothetical protein
MERPSGQEAQNSVLSQVTCFADERMDGGNLTFTDIWKQPLQQWPDKLPTM